MYVRACAISPGQGCAPPGLQHDQEAAKEGALRQARHLQAVGGRDLQVFAINSRKPNPNPPNLSDPSKAREAFSREA